MDGEFESRRGGSRVITIPRGTSVSFFYGFFFASFFFRMEQWN